MRRTPLTVLAVCIAFAIAGAQQSAPRPAALPAAIAESVAAAMKTFEVPGLALTIVKDGDVVLARGFGVKTLGRPGDVDAGTRFGIASNTKAFTATALGLLVEDGEIQWDAPVQRYLPWFQMSDSYVTREMTVRDLLVHRSGLGLGAGDLLWWPESTYNRDEIARRIRFLPLATSFRSAYAYDNVLYLVAGKIIEEVSGLSWEDFVSTRILAKVGMSGSTVRHSAALAAGNIATPHARVEGTVRPIAPFGSDNTNPAGGINSSAADMAKWMIVQLARGTLPDGTRLFSEATARELTTLVTPMPNPDPPSEIAAARSDFRGYALGFEVRDYRGHKIVTHTGGLPGYLSKVTMVPDLRLGVAVLTNQESGEAFNAITFTALDRFLHAPAVDWVTAFKTVRDTLASENAAAVGTTTEARDRSSRPSLPLEKYAGVYRDAWYGDVAITHANGRLAIRFTKTPSLVGDLEHWQHDTFVARWRDRELRADAFITFALNPDGSIDQAKMRAVSPETDFSFDFQDLLLEPVREP